MGCLIEILALNSMQRFQALRSWFRYPDIHPQVWVGVGIAFGLLLLLVILVKLRNYIKNRAWRLFNQQSGQMGLGKEERDILAYVAKAQGLKNPREIFRTDELFVRGATSLIQSPKFASLPSELQSKTKAAIRSVSQKLEAMADKSNSSSTTTRQIPRGGEITLTSPATLGTFDVTVVSNEPEEIIVSCADARELQAEQTLLARHIATNMIWEFDTKVISTGPRSLTLAHSKSVRFLNRRRFARIATRRQALVGAFAFFRSDAELQCPSLMPATITEIAGPGFLMNVKGDFNVGDKVLVVAKLVQGQVIQGLARVRRVLGQEGVIGVELIDLRQDEVARLVKETNQAATEGVEPKNRLSTASATK
jgi:hypothetical protein